LHQTFRTAVVVVFLVLATLLGYTLAAGGKLVIVRPSDAISLDPHRATTAPEVWVYNNIYETLVVLDEEMNVQPALAESWERIDDARMRFHLKQGVTFHDGTPFNAEAVKFTIDRVIDPDHPARGRAWLGPVVGAEVVDEHTVDIITDGPFGPLLNHLSMVFVVGIASPTAVETYGDEYGRNPVGTGPFKFQSWETNQSIVLVRNDDYHGEVPELEAVEFRVVPEEGARMLAFMRGDADMLLRAAPAELPLLRDDPRVKVYDVPGLRIVYIGLNHTQAPTGDVRVREAIAHAIDVNSINAFVVEDAMEAATGVLATAVFGYADTGLREKYAYDPERALELLAEAGYTQNRDGKLVDSASNPLRLVQWASQGRDLKDKELSEAVSAQLRELGFTIDYVQREWGAYLSALPTPEANYNLYTMGWVTMTGDADFGLYANFHSQDFNTNRSHYSNPTVDEALETARSSLDPEERLEAYAVAQRQIVEDVVWIPIYQTRETVVTQEWVNGYIPHPAEYYVRLAPVSLDR
jgi:peptide/nickel transport system substrate-binding protein